MFTELLKAFIVGGIICAIGQVLIDYTKLTPISQEPELPFPLRASGIFSPREFARLLTKTVSWAFSQEVLQPPPPVSQPLYWQVSALLWRLNKKIRHSPKNLRQIKLAEVLFSDKFLNSALL